MTSSKTEFVYKIVEGTTDCVLVREIEKTDDIADTTEGNSKYTVIEPLRDHNYAALPPSADTSNNLEQSEPIIPKKMSPRKPKITSLRMLYSCYFCGFTTLDLDAFNEHKKKHTKLRGSMFLPRKTRNFKKDIPNGYHQCPQCSFYAKNIGSVKLHMHIHDKGKAYKCSECTFCGKSINDLITHMQTTLCSYTDRYTKKSQKR